VGIPVEGIEEDSVVSMAVVAAAVASEAVGEVEDLDPVAVTATASVRPAVPRQDLVRTAATAIEISLAVDTILVAVDAHLMTDLAAAETVVTAEIAKVGDALAATWSPLADVKAVMAAAATVIETETWIDLVRTTIGSAATKAVAMRILASFVATDDSLAYGHVVGWWSYHTTRSITSPASVSHGRTHRLRS
jgi:hypothetical protein